MADTTHIPEPVNEKFPPFVALVMEVLQELGAVFTVDRIPIAPEPQMGQEDEE